MWLSDPIPSGQCPDKAKRPVRQHRPLLAKDLTAQFAAEEEALLCLMEAD